MIFTLWSSQPSIYFLKVTEKYLACSLEDSHFKDSFENEQPLTMFDTKPEKGMD